MEEKEKELTTDLHSEEQLVETNQVNDEVVEETTEQVESTNEALELESETSAEETQKTEDESATAEETVEEEPKSENYLNSKWYALHTFSGYENVAKENLEIVRGKYNLQDRIFDIIIPMEDVVEEKNGKRKVVSRKLMPGYIFIKMLYGDDIWHAVTLTRGITGFVGPKGRPLHLTDEEIRKMHLEKITVVDIDLSPNDKVEVLDGPLNGFAGTVTSVDYASEKCRVVVEMFGRETPVDLSLTQVRKLS